MRRAWIAVALLAASWLLGRSYYLQADLLAWGVLVALAVVLLGGAGRRRVPPLVAALSAVACVPAVVLMPWPWRAGPLLLAAGLVFHALPAPTDWPRRAGSALVAAGGILVAQGTVLLGYTAVVAREPNLPAPLASALAAAARWAGFDSALDSLQSNLAVFTMRRLHEIGATWALLIDPVSVAFFVGGLVLVLLRAWSALPYGRRRWACVGPAVRLAVGMAAWLLLRVLLLLGVYLHRALMVDYDAPVDLMGMFWSPWVHLALLAGPVLIAWRFALPDGRRDDTPPHAPLRSGWVPVGGAAATAVGAALLVAAVGWQPAGKPKQGRVLFDERHSQAPWPAKSYDTVRTDKPFTTETYGPGSAYHHTCLAEYCSRFYDVARLYEPIRDGALRDVDVLVLKVPSMPFDDEEVAAVLRFVQNGGGLLLMGEHTAVYGSGRNINRIAGELGFRFRYDCAFGMDSVFEQTYTPPLLPHPVVQHMPPMDFATSCTIDPEGPGRAVIQAAGLKNLHADYHASNFYPQAVNQPDMRYGPFVQLWATRRGAGRVLGFTDSTIFSCFAAFEPGKSELMLGMLAWLNRENTTFDPRLILALAGLFAVLGGIALGRPWETYWPALLAAGLLGWAGGLTAVRAANRAALPAPEAKRPFVRFGMDRTVSGGDLPRNGFISGEDDGFGQFERSILRVGCFFRRAEGADVTRDANAVIVLYPNRPVPGDYRDHLVRFVEHGGRLLVLDSPENQESTANSLLHPFGLKVTPAELAGQLSPAGDLPAVEVRAASDVEGGTPLFTLNGRPVAAAARKGEGLVVAIGFGQRFSDRRMGVISDVVPDATLRKVFDLAFALFRGVIAWRPGPGEGPAELPASAPATARARAAPRRPATRPATQPATRPATPPGPQ